MSDCVCVVWANGNPDQSGRTDASADNLFWIVEMSEWCQFIRNPTCRFNDVVPQVLSFTKFVCVHLCLDGCSAELSLTSEYPEDCPKGFIPWNYSWLWFSDLRVQKLIYLWRAWAWDYFDPSSLMTCRCLLTESIDQSPTPTTRIPTNPPNRRPEIRVRKRGNRLHIGSSQSWSVN